jgi:hypothetical protein
MRNLLSTFVAATTMAMVAAPAMAIVLCTNGDLTASCPITEDFVNTSTTDTFTFEGPGYLDISFFSDSGLTTPIDTGFTISINGNTFTEPKTTLSSYSFDYVGFALSFSVIVTDVTVDPFADFQLTRDLPPNFNLLPDPSPTPLPSTWTMMIVGFAGLVFFAYRRKKGTAALAAA